MGATWELPLIIRTACRLTLPVLLTFWTRQHFTEQASSWQTGKAYYETCRSLSNQVKPASKPLWPLLFITACIHQSQARKRVTLTVKAKLSLRVRSALVTESKRTVLHFQAQLRVASFHTTQNRPYQSESHALKLPVSFFIRRERCVCVGGVGGKITQHYILPTNFCDPPTTVWPHAAL